MSDNQTSDFLPSSDTELFFAKKAVGTLDTQLKRMEDMIRGQVPNGWLPGELQVARGQLNALNGSLQNSSKDGLRLPSRLSTPCLPLLRLAIEVQLETTIEKQEALSQVTHLDEPQLELDKQLELGRNLLSLPIFEQVKSAPSFSINSYLNLATITQMPGAAAISPRVFDDKFHILMSQSIFMKDLRYFREQCLVRNRSLSVGYIDIDNFGKLNKDLPGKETQVDKDVLPRFMSAVEAFVFGRGFAYREGGDEYLVLLPGATYAEAVVFFDGLRKHISLITYPNDISSPTVSIGVCTAEPSEHITALQVQKFANKAKAFAKNKGRNRVAGYRPDELRSDDTLTILPE